MDTQQVNIFDEPIEECCSNPITGFFRDGFCHTDQLDRGLHIVCSLMNDEFLNFSKSRGNFSLPAHVCEIPAKFHRNLAEKSQNSSKHANEK